ncbi:nitroreductase family deazaflavin-dependent oxidoreductase [Microbacterium sp.]|uniref:nitroreductase family deazaflavin-dependent oxidoreductase n=1 Tax=Microbacterium sp. TaxID=51671 RepID=UPI0037CA78E0
MDPRDRDLAHRRARDGEVIREFRSSIRSDRRAPVNLLLIHTVGAKSGVPRVTPLTCALSREGWLVAAAKAGSARNPGWYHNAVAHPDLTVEVAGEGAVPVRAVELHGRARDLAWRRLLEVNPRLRGYARRTTRSIPVLRLMRR